MVTLVLNRLRQEGDVEESISPTFLVRNWPPAFAEWSTKAVRDAFFASPRFPRLLNPEAIKDTIARGVSSGFLAYIGRTASGDYEPFFYQEDLHPNDVEIADDVFIITSEEAEKHIQPPALTQVVISPGHVQIKPGIRQTFTAKGLDPHGREMQLEAVNWKATGGEIDRDGVFLAGEEEGNFVVTATADGISGTAAAVVSKGGGPPPPPHPPPPDRGKRISWSGEVSPQKWMNFYTKVLSRFVRDEGLKISIH